MLKTTIKTFLLILLFQLTLQAREINLDKLIDTATKTDKHLFVWLHKTDCGYCQNMQEFTLKNEVIADFIKKNFIYVHINVRESDKVYYQGFEGSGMEFAKHIGYNFYPTSLFFDKSGDLTFVEVGFLDSESLPNEEKFFKILNFISSKSYENSEFSDYKFKYNGEL